MNELNEEASRNFSFKYIQFGRTSWFSFCNHINKFNIIGGSLLTNTQTLSTFFILKLMAEGTLKSMEQAAEVLAIVISNSGILMNELVLTETSASIERIQGTLGLFFYGVNYFQILKAITMSLAELSYCWLCSIVLLFVYYVDIFAHYIWCHLVWFIQFKTASSWKVFRVCWVVSVNCKYLRWVKASPMRLTFILFTEAEFWWNYQRFKICQVLSAMSMVQF